MELNKFYDIIIAQHLEYENYNKFLQEKQVELNEKRKENAKTIEQIAASGQIPDEASIQNISDKIYDYHTEEVLYKQDCISLFYTLYLNVKTYIQIEGGMILPKEITELCKSLEHTMPKPYYIVEKKDSKLIVSEVEVGRAEKQRNYFKSSEVKRIQEDVLKMLENELDKNKQ